MLDLFPFRDPVEYRRLENVGTGVDPVGGCFVSRRFLDERFHSSIGMYGNDTEARRVINRREMYGSFSTKGAMLRYECCDIEIVDHISVQSDERLVGEPGKSSGKADGTTGVERFGLHRIVHFDACDLAGWELVLEDFGQVAERKYRFGDPTTSQVHNHPLEHRETVDRKHLLRRRQGERSESCAESAYEDHCAD